VKNLNSTIDPSKKGVKLNTSKPDGEEGGPTITTMENSVLNSRPQTTRHKRVISGGT
jgi:hypothetical protein